jgi:hypothetical protein
VQIGQKEVCPSCGVPLLARVPRCPACGFLLASAPGPVYQNSLPPNRPRPGGATPSLLPAVVAVAGLAVTGAIAVIGFWLVRQRDDARAALPATSATLNTAPSSAPAPVVLEPTTLFAKAKSAALAWQTDATLLEIDIAPVANGKVDPNGKLVFVFGKPSGQKLGPGTRVRATAFVVTADASGLQGDEHPAGKAVSVGEPNCIFEDVLAKVEKAVPSGDKLHLHYAMSDNHARGVWRVSRVGDADALRTLDGANCAIIVH